MTGKVFLVGAGPGDPGLITEKATRCIAAADAVVYDYLAPSELLKYARPNAELIYVGKKGGDHTLGQDKINALLVEKALAGNTVARLKGGDPFIFGRGGEEIEELVAADIVFEVVPGVTSAVAAPAYAGIPLTHRQFASCVTFITGHEDPAKTDSMINWNTLACTGGTLVFLMGVKNLPNIARRLREAGMDKNTPAALVRWGTTPVQQTVTGTLETIYENVRQAGLKPPCIIVIGDVVRLRDKMKWFENRPLFGRRIVVTRARNQASGLVQRLSELGASVTEVPVIKIQPVKDMSRLDTAIKNIGEYHWLIFTSVNGVKVFFERLAAHGLDTRALGRINTSAIGPATAAVMRENGLNADIMPESYRAESVVKAFADLDMAGKKVILPRAEGARPVLPEELSKMGASVDEIISYRAVRQEVGAEDFAEKLKAGAIDMVTFTSSSTVRNFMSLLPESGAKQMLSGVAMAAIGPVTAETLADAGFQADVVAEEYTIEGLCSAVAGYYKNRG
ncbi:MAG: uroporphyrinogen-III C-methyltransferase [Desulfobacteraceae bacterium]|nr:uroporphyrinogen-III C-methyltransferase [Desulfobacteraceae bacterium]